MANIKTILIFTVTTLLILGGVFLERWFDVAGCLVEHVAAIL